MGILIVFDIHVQASWELFLCPVDKHSIHLHSTGGTLSSAGLSLPHKRQAKIIELANDIMGGPTTRPS